MIRTKMSSRPDELFGLARALTPCGRRRPSINGMMWTQLRSSAVGVERSTAWVESSSSRSATARPGPGKKLAGRR